MSQGWIKLHRELVDKAIWRESTPEQKTILITLLMMANHKEKEWEWQGERFKAEPGQFVTSLPSIAEKCGKGITIQNVRTALRRFQKYNFLTDESTNRNRLITIVNWGIYQDSKEEGNRQPNRQLTGNQQATNRQLTANKNDKNDKNDKNKDYDSKIKDLLSFFSKSINDFSELNKKYWDVIRETRRTGNVAKSVIYKNMNMWRKYDPIIVEYALKEHIEHRKGMKEHYTIGIMRNTSREEAEQKLIYKPKRRGEVNISEFNLDDEATSNPIISFLE